MGRAAGLLAFTLVIAVVVTVPPASATTHTPVPDAAPIATLGSVPFFPNIRVTDGSSPYAWQVEPTMVINQSGTIFVGWKEASTAEGPGRRVGFSSSEDVGTTWAPNILMPQSHANQGCANSELGHAIGAGWYASGTSAIAAVDTGVVPTGDGVRQAFAGWAGDASGSSVSGSAAIVMDGPNAAFATWRTEYLVQVLTEVGAIEGGGWHPSGAQATLVAPAEVVSGGQRYAFAGWTGDVSSSDRSISLMVGGPMTVHATWTNLGAAGGFGGSTILLATLLFAITVTAVAIVLWRRRRDE